MSRAGADVIDGNGKAGGCASVGYAVRIERATKAEATKTETEAAMMDLLVQLVVVAVILAMLVLFILALDRKPHRRNQDSQTVHRRHR